MVEKDLKMILYKLLLALNFIHSANIIHRDIKPANFLIDDESNIMLCDFGMSRAVPKKTLTGIEKDIKEYRRSLFKKVTSASSKHERTSRFLQYKNTITAKLSENFEERNTR